MVLAWDGDLDHRRLRGTNRSGAGSPRQRRRGGSVARERDRGIAGRRRLHHSRRLRQNIWYLQGEVLECADFRGFPHLPGNDRAYGYVSEGGEFDGRALVP
jgi:hypothetical protein